MITGNPRYIPEALVGRILGKYRIREIIGRGGMGVVYKVWDTLEEKEKAIKMVPPEVASSPLAFEDLKREISLASGIVHPNVVKVLSLEAQDGQYFIVMEYIEGESLEKKMSRFPDRKLKESDVIRIMIKVAEGMTEAHNQNIIHRDLKPRNIMESVEGQVKILDFGVSHRMSRSLTELTGQDNIGTWPYMAPEQLSNRFGRENEQVDVWAFGVTMYQLLTGDVPYKTREQIISIDEKPFPLEGVSRKTQRVIMKCLEKDREKRYHQMKQIIRDLETISPSNGKNDRPVNRPVISVEPQVESGKFIEWQRIVAGGAILISLVFLVYAFKLNKNFSYQFSPQISEVTQERIDYESYLKQIRDAIAIDDISTARNLIDKARKISYTAFLKELERDMDSRNAILSLRNDTENVIQFIGSLASDDEKKTKCREFLANYGSVIDGNTIEIDDSTLSKISRIKAFLNESENKTLSISELSPGIVNGFDEQLRRIEIPDIPESLRVMGRIAITIQVDKNGKLSVSNVNIADLTLSDPQSQELIKRSITKKMSRISLTSPKDKKGASVSVKPWTIRYKVGKYLNKLILTREG